jgi:hypothetical protein
MKSSALEKNISPVEITTTQFGLWLHLQNEEFFLSYDDHHYFKEATLNNIYHVEVHHKTHLYWPDIDVDLCVSILKNPHHFPLITDKKINPKLS